MTGPRLLLLGSLLSCLGCSGTEETPVFGPGPEVWAGFDPAWTVVHPTNGPERLLAACAVASGEAWTVGTGGVVLHQEGRRWLRERSDTGATLADVATDGRLVCAVGSDGAIIVREDGAWRREASGTSRALRAVTVAADGTVWAGGEGGVLLRREAGSWRPSPRTTTADVTALATWADTLFVGDAAGVVSGLAGTGGRELGAFGGTGVLRLTVSPSGTLFAAADSLYRYDSGRWVALRRNSDHRLAANDNLVFSGTSAYRHDGSWYYVSWSGTELAAACAVGPAGALAVGQYGAFAWLRDGAWRTDLDGGCTWGIVPLADGTACALVDNQVIVRDDDRWNVVAAFPDTLFTRLADGLDRSHLLLRVGSGYVLTGATGSVTVPLPSDWLSQALIAPDGAVVGADYQGLVAWDGQEWRREYTIQGEEQHQFTLSRVRSGELFAINGSRVLRRDEGCWREVARLSWPAGIYNREYRLIAAGRFPDSFVVLGGSRWLNWDARADSVQGDWRYFDPPRNEARVAVFSATVSAIYAVDDRTSRVLRLQFTGPEAGGWVAMTGSLPDRVSSLRVDPDGSITAFAASTGRIWRHPGRPVI